MCGVTHTQNLIVNDFLTNIAVKEGIYEILFRYIQAISEGEMITV